MALKLIHSKQVDTLVHDCIAGSAKAQKALYDLFSPKMFGVCLRLLKNKMDAEDALHEGFIRVFDKLKTYSNKGSFEGWMRSLFINVALRMLEKRNKLRIHEEATEEYTHPVASSVVSQLHHQELIQLVNSLPDGYRVVFVLYAIEGYSHKEIAKELSISEGTSKSQLSRARNMLKSKVCELYQQQPLEKSYE